VPGTQYWAAALSGALLPAPTVRTPELRALRDSGEVTKNVLVRRFASALIILACGLTACGPSAVPSAPTAAPATTATAAPAAQSATSVPVQPGPTAATQPTPAVASAATATPKRGGTLVIAASADPGQFNPAISTAGGAHFVADNIYNGLVALDAQLNPKPDLADRWDARP
jgi:ABC-type transport system substrate-binding protein